MNSFLNKLKLRGKLLALVLPLVIIPIFVVAAVIGLIANQQAYLGITKTSKDDLKHVSEFCIDLLNSHYQQFQVYKLDKARNLNNELATLTALSYNLVAVGLVLRNVFSCKDQVSMERFLVTLASPPE